MHEHGWNVQNINSSWHLRDGLSASNDSNYGTGRFDCRHFISKPNSPHIRRIQKYNTKSFTIDTHRTIQTNLYISTHTHTHTYTDTHTDRHSHTHTDTHTHTHRHRQTLTHTLLAITNYLVLS